MRAIDCSNSMTADMRFSAVTRALAAAILRLDRPRTLPNESETHFATGPHSKPPISYLEVSDSIVLSVQCGLLPDTRRERI